MDPDDPDPGCVGDNCVEDCANGRDDDADGRRDCLDPDCNGVQGCELDQEQTCDDGFDNDGDTVTDCADPSCDKVGLCEFGQESSCADGVDNDGDGDADCLDANCSGVDGCEPGRETTCADGVDNDVDGMFDCDDDDCAGSGVCLVSSCPSGTSLVTGLAADTPMPINDNSMVTSTLNIADDGVLVRVAAVVTANHTFPSDLDLALIAPGGSRFNLSSDNGGSTTDAYTNTVFSDLGSMPIGSATAPYEDAYQPEQSLSPLLGSSPTGTWSLEVTDDAGGDTGQLMQFSVVLCSCAAPCAAESSCTNGADDDGDGAADCADPGCAGTGFCEYGAEASCGDGEDNDGDSDADCADTDCMSQVSCILACPAGSSMTTFAAGDLPLAVNDNSTVNSVIPVPTSGTVTLAAVELSIDHTYASDLDITLISPANTRVLLSDDNGGSGEGYAGTLFADAAQAAITGGSSPFTGPFTPEQPLSGVASEASAGDWKLEVVDDAGSDTGSVTEFSLHLCIE